MSKSLRMLAVVLVVALADQDARAAEGGYSNYIPGTYGDFAMAVAPTETWTLRNDVYFYDASTARSVRSGNLEVGVDLQFLMNFTTVLYKPDVEVFGGQYAAGVFVPLNLDLDLDSRLSIGDRTVSASDSASGLGDIALVPFALYWNTGNIHTCGSRK